ncbi:16S rRNA (guanine(966)-N(2))-methyltransferase RsmD [Vagococcus sp.]|uniref:16S rRNA (guanine(966)-N(2))-methyltransferase RsmD n=1 Tax=Vagococcus sp. TaxID=1933889 RepID=UPI003F99BE0C
MRVIAGDFKGRKLNSLKGDNTRPTSDKIKGAIFNMIGPYFDGEKVLDLYSGSANLAIEAISRGAGHAYCFDHHFQAITVINENIALTKALKKFTVKKMEAQKGLLWLKAQKQSFDIILLDPPYAEQMVVADLEKMLALELINTRATIICEVNGHVDLPEVIGSLEMVKCQDYRTTKVYIYRLFEEE